MRANRNLVITGLAVSLVPYRREHVDLYHTWMQDPYLQATTESEPLSLEEEYEMQQSWAEDEDKCTFILLDRSQPDTPGTGSHGGAMAGDVNLYFNDVEDRGTTEIEAMVAEPGSRRKGIAREALSLFMAYAAAELRVTTFRAKILEDNAPSLSLFASLGFAETKRMAVFREVHMELAVAGDVAATLAGAAARLNKRAYDPES
ncbi:hypothetical protein FOA52_011368 [Chlamydomonas sp. UWO 241]|nr:hypothetical protein FOA52_011368 [Chlamydomonas sp. UWO 241]